MTTPATKDATILMLAERIFICSRLLTAAAERLHWDSDVVQGLMQELRDTLPVKDDVTTPSLHS